MYYNKKLAFKKTTYDISLDFCGDLRKELKYNLRSVVWFMMVHDSPNDFLSIPNKILKSVLIIR